MDAMKPARMFRLFIALIMVLSVIPVISQGSLQLNFQGMMKDINENIIREDEFDLSVKVLEEPSGKTLWESKYSMKTDNNGWFGFEIDEFESFFKGEQKEELTVHFGLFPTERSRWIEKDSDFMVTYTIKKVIRNDSLLFTITRLEGTELLFSQFEDVLFFNDSFPFAYLLGGFMLSVNTTDANLSNLRSVISGDDPAPEEVRSRGMKGGFAVGGYRKNQ